MHLRLHDTLTCAAGQLALLAFNKCVLRESNTVRWIADTCNRNYQNQDRPFMAFDMANGWLRCLRRVPAIDDVTTRDRS
jgi:hypothetical protein